MLRLDGAAPNVRVPRRGTNHAWVNTGTEPRRIAFVPIDAKPAV